MKKVVNFIIGATMGALVGATAAILFAPYSGEELRTEVTGRVESFRDDVIAASENKRIELETQLANLRQPKS